MITVPDPTGAHHAIEVTGPLADVLEDWTKRYDLSPSEKSLLARICTNGFEHLGAHGQQGVKKITEALLKKTGDTKLPYAAVRCLREAYFGACRTDRTGAEREAAWWKTSFLTRLVPGSWMPTIGARMMGKRLKIVDLGDNPNAVEAEEVPPGVQGTRLKDGSFDADCG